MYEILFHVTSIALLEISFFFYYIGPKETEMFLHYMERILQNPLIANNNIISDDVIPDDVIPDDVINFNIPNSMHVQNRFLNTYSLSQQTLKQLLQLNKTTEIQEELYQENLQGISDRKQQNYELFLLTIEYWTIFALFSIFVYCIQCSYSKYANNQKKKGGIVSVTSEPDVNRTHNEYTISEMEMITYRKTSIDSEDIESNLPLPQIIEEKNKQCFNKFGKIGCHYLVFCGCIVTFQYFFFQYIAFAYKPLSIQEIKYFLYTHIMSEIVITK